VNVSLALRLAAPSSPRPVGTAEVHNDGEETLRFWCVGNSWGDTALRFEITTSAGVVRVVRSALTYTRDVPATVEVGPGADLRLAFDLGDGTWQVEPSGDDVPVLADAHLQAFYEIGPSSEADDQQVWTGLVRSARIRVGQPT
jgi:hypothetical protein